MAQQPQEVRQEHPFFMYDAIMRQPAAMDEMLAKPAGAVQPVAADLAPNLTSCPIGVMLTAAAAQLKTEPVSGDQSVVPRINRRHSLAANAPP